MELIRWLEERHNIVPVKIENILATHDWCSDLFDFVVSIEHMHRDCVGRSVDRSPIAALGKAIVEALERVVTLENRVQIGSGIAAHFNRELAKRNAALELIERDAVLYHHLTSTPFEPATISWDENRDLPIIGCIKKAAARDISIHFYKANAMGGTSVVICVARERGSSSGIPGRMLFGFGSSFEVAQSARKAFLECVQNLPFFFRTNSKAFTRLDEFSVQKKFGPRDHGFLGMDREYCSKIAFLFPALSTSCRSPVANQTGGTFEFTDLHTQAVPYELGLRFVCAYHPMLIPLYWGQVPDEVLNNGRLLGTKNTNNIPHFIG